MSWLFSGPKQQKPKPAALADIDITTSDTGTPIPVVFGTMVCQNTNVVWYGDLKYVAVKTGSGK